MRYHRLDTLRGITLISMIIYHAMWDIVYMFVGSISFFKTDIGYIWQQSICCTFILLSGFCFSLGKHKIKRGIQVFLGGLIITLVTMFFMPTQIIMYGVLTLIGTSVILAGLLEPIIKKINPYLGFIGSIGSFLLFRNINRGYLGLRDLPLVNVPTSLYKNQLTTFLGFPMNGLVSMDYFSVIPWFFLFLTGIYLYYIFKERDMLKICEGKERKVLGWIGKHSLILYMLHQPVVYGLLWLLTFIMMMQA